VFRQVKSGRYGQAGVVDVQARAQRGDPAGHRAARRQDVGGLERSDDVAEAEDDRADRPVRHRGLRPEIPRDVTRHREQPLRDQDEEVLAQAERRRGDLRRGRARRDRAPLVKADADGRFARGRDVEPADVLGRVGEQADTAGPLGADVEPGRVEIVPPPPVIGDVEPLAHPLDLFRLELRRPERAVHPPRHGKPGPGPGTRVRKQVQFAADDVIVKRHRLPDQRKPPGLPPNRPRLRSFFRRSRLRERRDGRVSRAAPWPAAHEPADPAHRTAAWRDLSGPGGPAREGHRLPAGLFPDGQREVEVGHDVVGGLRVNRVHGGQGLRHPRDPGRARARAAPPAGRGKHRAVQFGLGQQPQIGFRALAVHAHIVLPARTAANRRDRGRPSLARPQANRVDLRARLGGVGA
jgi:hypothetical protein